MVGLWSRSVSSFAQTRRTRLGAMACGKRPVALAYATLLEARRPLWMHCTSVACGGAGGRRKRAQAHTQSTLVSGHPISPPTSTVLPCAAAPEAAAPPLKPKRETRKRKSSAAAPAPAAEKDDASLCAKVTAVRIHVGELVKEWRALQGLGSPGIPSATGSDGATHAAATRTGSSPPLPSRIEDVPDRAAAVSAILKRPQDFPRLHTLFFLERDGAGGSAAVSQAPRSAVAGRFEPNLVGAADVVRSEQDLAQLLSAMRSYRQLAQQSAWTEGVSQRLGDVVLRELAAAWREAGPGDVAGVKRAVAVVLLELHRSQFGRAHRSLPAGRAAAAPATPTSAPRRDAREGDEWPADAVAAFFHTTVSPIATHISGDDGADGTLADKVTDYSLLVLAATIAEDGATRGIDLLGCVPVGVGNEKTARPPSAAAAWRTASTRVAGRLQAQLARCCSGGHDPERTDPGASQALVDDVLDALLVCQRFDLVMPVSVRQRLHADAVRAVGGVCHAVEQHPDVFLCVCRRGFAAKLAQLRESPGSLYEQLCTDVFGAARAFLVGAGAKATARLLLEAEAAGGEGGGTGWVRPPLHGATAQLCYLLMCVGYAPEAILNSGLGLTLSAVELTDVTAAGARFSAAFASHALPVRVHAALVGEALGLARKALTLSQRAVRSSTDALDGEVAGRAPFAARVAAGGAASVAGAAARRTRSLSAAPPRVLTPAQRKRVKYLAAQDDRTAGRLVDEAAGPDEGSALAVTTQAEADQLAEQAYYVAVGALVESVCRGDAAAVSRIAQALHPLLELDGSCLYLVESAELVTQRVTQRLALAGPAQMTTAMEQAFLGFTGACQARVSDAVLRRTLRGPTAAARGGGEGGGETADAVRGGPTGGPRPPTRPRDPPHRPSAAAAADGLPGPEEDLDELRELVFRLTVCALTLGMKPSCYEQLISLHAAVRGGPVARAPASQGTAAATEAFRTVQRLARLMDDLTRSRLPVARHPQSACGRLGDVALNKIIAVQLHATADAATGFSGEQPVLAAAGATAARQRTFLLSVVHLLYRLGEDHPVEVEPEKLRAYRTDILDPGLCHVLHAIARDAQDGPAAAVLTLPVLAEITVVMCTARTIHQVSPSLYAAITAHVIRSPPPPPPAPERRSARPTTPHHAALAAQRLLTAAAAICLRASPPLTAQFLEMAAVLHPRLTVQQTIAVLDASLERQVPPTAAPMRAMLSRLTDALAAAVGSKAGMAVPDMVAALSTLSRYDEQTAALSGGGVPAKTRAVDIPYAAVMLHLCGTDPHRPRGMGLRQCGNLVQVAASLQGRPERLASFTEEERACVVRVPRVMAAAVLQAPQQGAEHDIPFILAGYAKVPDTALRTRVMRACISRAIRACPVLTPEEVVTCVEAFCAAGAYHAYLLGVLLGRVADATQTFSLELSLRLLRCGSACGHEHVRMACLTAARPVFVGHVRHLLQSDPQQVVTVGATSATILASLRMCFPHDAISAAVLETIATYHKGAGVAVVTSALELVAARGSRDYGALRTLADHCVHDLIPVCDPDDLAVLSHHLVVCGVRSGVLMAAVTERFSAVAAAASGHALAQLSRAWETACVDVDQNLVESTVDRVTALVDGYLDALEQEEAEAEVGGRTRAGRSLSEKEPPFTTAQATAVLRHARTVGRLHYTLVVPAVDALLTYLEKLWAAHDGATAPRLCTPEGLLLTDVEVVLSACVEQASKPRQHAALVRRCAARLLSLLAIPGTADDAGRVASGADTMAEVVRPVKAQQQEGSSSSSSSPSEVAAQADLTLLTSIANHMGRATTSAADPTLVQCSSPIYSAMQVLFTALHERRSALLKRQLLVDSARQALRAAGRDTHPQLYDILVENKEG